MVYHRHLFRREAARSSGGIINGKGNRLMRGESEIVTSRRNRRIVAIRSLDQRKDRAEQRRFRVEGLQLLHMALDAGASPLEALYCPSQFAGKEAPHLLHRFRQMGVELLEVTPEVMQSVSEREVCQGLVATFALPATSFRDLNISGRDLVVVLDRLQDPGNAGTLIRTADAVGAAAVVLIEPCVDPFDPKTVRGTMGSLFNLPIAQTGDLAGLFGRLSGRGLQLVGADARVGVLWGEGVLRGGVALLCGNEARGISADVRSYVQSWARLPIMGRAESLNVAVAGGVLMYAWLRENS
jgi:TrmH family RNA methyltransferase